MRANNKASRVPAAVHSAGIDRPGHATSHGLQNGGLCLHLRRKFGWNMKGLVFDFTLYMIHSIAVYVLICWNSLCYSI